MCSEVIYNNQNIYIYLWKKHTIAWNAASMAPVIKLSMVTEDGNILILASPRAIRYMSSWISTSFCYNILNTSSVLNSTLNTTLILNNTLNTSLILNSTLNTALVLNSTLNSTLTLNSIVNTLLILNSILNHCHRK